MPIRKKNVSIFRFIIVVFLGSFLFQSCSKTQKTEKGVSIITIDSTAIKPFFESHPELQKYDSIYVDVYRYYDFHYIWFNEKGMTDYGKSLYKRVKNIEDEGIYAEYPYQTQIDDLYEEDLKNPEDNSDAELLMTGLYAFYVDHAYKGIDEDVAKELGWLLPRKKIDETALLKKLVSDKKWSDEDTLRVKQYYQMRDKLKDFKKIQEEGGWDKIETSEEKIAIKPGDSSEIIHQIRKRLAITGELQKDNESNIYDEDLKKAVAEFQLHHGLNKDSIIKAEHIAAFNVPVQDYIKKIVVNLERLRWVPTKINEVEEFILVNIPAYHLDYFKNGKVVFDSDVIVGGVMHKTVIFDGEMSYLAFSPYWNIPPSIIKNEIKPGMEKDDKYLEKRNMEWNNGNVRQLPGASNSLGLVKFMFPNENNIYLHDTPAKSLFDSEDRARSHGCIRVEKARDLAVAILEGDKEWNPEKIDSAMHAGKENTYSLKNKIPVYIGYFTAWIDENGEINFYKDVYKRDDKLADLLKYKQ